MRVAIAWNWPSRLLECSFRFEQYVAGLRALGHQPLLVCTPESAEGFDARGMGADFHLCATREALRDPAFWREVGAGAVLIVTWNRMADELDAIRAAGSRAIALTDTDGRAGSKYFWKYHLERQILYQPKPWRFFREWLALQARQRFWRHFPEDLESVRSTEASDVVAVGHPGSRRNLGLFLDSMEAGHLAAKIRVVPFTIGGAFLLCPVPAVKDDLVLAIGRWRDPQKNADLLRETLGIFLMRRPMTRVEIFGDGALELFAPLAGAGNLALRGPQPQAVVAEALSRARTLLFSSRWEGCPHAALEMMALGGTLVGPPIASLASWTEDPRNGRVAKARPRALARALEAEMAAWDGGERDARAQAARWRAAVDPAEVCRRLLE